MCVCVWGGGGGGAVGGGGSKLPKVGDKLPGWCGVGQDKLLHRLKRDTDEETNHLTELSHNNCTAVDETA